MGGEQQGTGLDTVDDQTTKQHSRSCITRNAQGEQRNHGPADGGVIGGLGGDYAVNNAGSKFLRGFGFVFNHCVCQQIGCGTTDAGQNTNAGANQRGNQEIPFLAQKFF